MHPGLPFVSPSKRYSVLPGAHEGLGTQPGQGVQRHNGGVARAPGSGLARRPASFACTSQERL